MGLNFLRRKHENLPQASLKQLLRPKPSSSLVRLGSDYGGWIFEHADYLRGCSVISAGAGEDISWETEFSQVYGASVAIYDPTPRAYEHFLGVQRNIGRPRSQGYSLTGLQQYSSYPLERVSPNLLRFERFALAGSSGPGILVLPLDENHVSGELLTGLDSAGALDRQKISVHTLRLREVLEVGVPPQLLKMDIEGSELDVLEDSWDVLEPVSQILVEFDALKKRSKMVADRIVAINTRLDGLGFTCRHVWQGYNALFVRRRP